jgi:hypothetical protein
MHYKMHICIVIAFATIYIYISGKNKKCETKLHCSISILFDQNCSLTLT